MSRTVLTASRIAVAILLLVGSSAGGAMAREAGDPTPAEIFERRIMPIFKSAKPSSCVECHLAGVDLKDYILDSAEKTFVSLRDQGLVDLGKPESSRILDLIRMGENAKDPSLIKDSVRSQEYRAFASWIVASCKEPGLRDAPKLQAGELAGPSREPEVIRHARTDQVLASFERVIWSQRFRCTSCHAPNGTEAARLIQEQGTDEFLWFAADAATTMRNLIAGGFIDVKRPEQSLLLRKPTNQVKHGGGKKMEVGDAGYKAFRGWLEDYARTVGDQYQRSNELPAESPQRVFATEHWLKIENTPAEWDDKLLQVSVYAYDQMRETSEREPLATSDRAVWGKGKLWQHSLIALATRGTDRAADWQRAEKPTLPPGRYLIKVFVDRQGRLARDWKASMDEREYVGEIEIRTDWPTGYGQMTVIDAPNVISRLSGPLKSKPGSN